MSLSVDSRVRNSHNHLKDSLIRINTAQKALPSTVPQWPIQHEIPKKSKETWLSCADIVDNADVLDEWCRKFQTWLQKKYGETPQQVMGGYLMSWYLSVPARVAALLFHAERRVPDLRPEDLAFSLGNQRPNPTDIALLSSRFACLPTDPMAACPNATCVADETALAALLRARFIGHAARFITVFSKRTRLGQHTLWAGATDALDKALWLSGRRCGNESAGAADAAFVLPERFQPFTSASTVRPDNDSTAWTRRRESCCFHYVLKNGSGPCDTCPRICPRQPTNKKDPRQPCQ